MDDSVGMEVVKCMYKLLSNFSDFSLWKVPVILKYLKKLSLSKFCYHTKFMGSLKRVK